MSSRPDGNTFEYDYLSESGEWVSKNFTQDSTMPRDVAIRLRPKGSPLEIGTLRWSEACPTEALRACAKAEALKLMLRNKCIEKGDSFDTIRGRIENFKELRSEGKWSWGRGEISRATTKRADALAWKYKGKFTFDQIRKTLEKASPELRKELLAKADEVIESAEYQDYLLSLKDSEDADKAEANALGAQMLSD